MNTSTWYIREAEVKQKSRAEQAITEFLFSGRRDDSKNETTQPQTDVQHLFASWSLRTTTCKNVLSNAVVTDSYRDGSNEEIL
jgi:hypothetical protein